MQRGIALFGNHISYSISPVIHNTAFSITGLPYTYLTVDIEPERFEKALDAVQILNFAGANVTVPYKEKVMKYISKLSESAEKIGAVNTLYFENGRIHGDNTDSQGFYNAYRTELQSLGERTVLIVGAGGAARAVCDALITNILPEQIIIANRNPDRADKVTEHIKAVYGYNSVKVIPADLTSLRAAAKEATGIIQTTPIGSGKYEGQCPVPQEFLFKKNQIVIDLIYNPVETPFLRNAEQNGARTRNGISMLLHQAALSFNIWTGERFPMDRVTATVMEIIKTLQHKGVK